MRPEMSEIMTFLEIAGAEKNRRNPILGNNNVDSKPEPNLLAKSLDRFPAMLSHGLQ